MTVSTTCNLCGAALAPDAVPVWEKDGFSIVRCPACGLVFRSDPPSRDDLGEIYSLSYFRDDLSHEDRQGYSDYLADAELHRLNARRRLRLLRRHAPRGTLLDVGCAAGFFVLEAIADGWDATGIDISEEMIDWGRRELRVPVSNATVTDVRRPDGGLSAITMWDYIEHSIDPSADVAASYELLADGGILALSTGDVESLVARISGSRWHLLTPHHHNFFFGRRTLTELLERAGFDVRYVGRPSTSYSVAHLAYKLQTVGPLGPLRRAAAALRRSRAGRLSFPVNLYDIVTLVARKPPRSSGAPARGRPCVPRPG